jgi:hypothetical protein
VLRPDRCRDGHVVDDRRVRSLTYRIMEHADRTVSGQSYDEKSKRFCRQVDEFKLNELFEAK